LSYSRFPVSGSASSTILSLAEFVAYTRTPKESFRVAVLVISGSAMANDVMVVVVTQPSVLPGLPWVPRMVLSL